ncbi:TPA: hypothetical protein OMU12_004760 [Enterobacter cloacae]|nr:hypothetical protein [Enterobacter cloacae]
MSKCLTVSDGMTWRDAEDAYIRKYGATGPVQVLHSSVNIGSKECVLFGAGVNAMGLGEIQTNGPASCVGAPPTPDPRCTFSNIPVIDYGVISTGAVDGLTASVQATLSCELSANIVLHDVTGMNGEITLGDWGKGKITVDGKGFPANFQVNKGDTYFNFTSSIFGKPTDAGEFRGSFIITVGYD